MNIRMICIGIAFLTGFGAHGAEAAFKAAAPVKKVAVVAAKVVPVHKGGRRVEGVMLSEAGEGLLQQAYHLLHRADHDYKGHRARAMHEIEEAAKFFGVHLRGDGRGDENQGSSDHQLGEAKGLLEQASGELSGRPLHHVENAIGQLARALSIK
jgi:hypothetical protein